MDLNWLETFLVAAEEGNLRRAAERLHLAQPTVTQQIQKLEAACGCPLFDRVGRQLVLNAAGRRFQAHASDVWARYHEGLADLARLQQGYDVTLRLVCSPLIATTYLPRWVQAYQRERRNVEFAVEICESQQILERLLQGGADLAFSRLAATHPRLTRTPLYADPVVMVAPHARTDMDEPPRTAEEWLADEVVFTHCHPEYWDALVPALRRVNPALRTMKVSQVHVALHWIAEGMGVSFLPKSTIRRDVLRGTVEEVPLPAVPLPTAYTYLLLPIAASAAARSFAEHVLAYMKERPVS
ncbi:MAG: LysR family transcriptional regulator [Alicyclobacillus sp.]|nr:LysR family transcriptional regulator [Alicyclobacillus sp.]